MKTLLTEVQLILEQRPEFWKETPCDEHDQYVCKNRSAKPNELIGVGYFGSKPKPPKEVKEDQRVNVERLDAPFSQPHNASTEYR